MQLPVPSCAIPCTATLIAVDWCEHMGIRVLGLEGLALTDHRLLPQLELVLDCSADHIPHGAATAAQCAECARQLLWEWSAIERCFMVLTLERKYRFWVLAISRTRYIGLGTSKVRSMHLSADEARGKR
jgi:hypothetical protein